MTVPSKTFVVMLCAILGMTIAGVQTIPGWIKAKYATASSDELNAMVRIAQADTFCFGGTGIAAAPSPTDIMFEHFFSARRQPTCSLGPLSTTPHRGRCLHC